MSPAEATFYCQPEEALAYLMFLPVAIRPLFATYVITAIEQLSEDYLAELRDCKKGRCLHLYCATSLCFA